MGVTRRIFGTGLLGLGVGLGLGLGARAAAERPSAARLADALNGKLGTNPFQARFDVPRLTVTSGSVTRMEADIRLDWTPGMRTRQIVGVGSDADAAWHALLEDALAGFADTVPGFAAGPASV